MTGGDSVKVAVRVRPFNQREIAAQSKCVVEMRGKSTVLHHPTSGDKKQFTFDHSYWSHDGYNEKESGYLEPQGGGTEYADQQRVYEDLGKDILANAWEGYNATLFAYGQTGSGKSYSMIGYGANKGIVPITCQALFQAIDSSTKEKGKEMQITFSMLEIYNEQIRDLLAARKGPKVRQNRNQSFYVEGLRQLPCRDYATIERLMEEGTISRTTASTNMNATSSRSHMVITIKFKQVFNNELGESTTKTSEINLVDLAGSERAQSTGAVGDRLKEASSINTSLLTLGSVIKCLAEGDPKVVVPYRTSVLTMLLKSALGGNSKTVMIAALSPAAMNYEETLSTLRYADRAKKIKNKAVINLSPTEKLIMDLKQENARLLKLLQAGGAGGVGNKDEVQRLLALNESQMREMTKSWDQKLEEAKREWEMGHQKGTTDHRVQNHPYFQNVNEDPQLSGVIKKFICEGQTVVGRLRDTKIESSCKYIEFRGLGIQERHCTITCAKKTMSLEPTNNSEVIINGVRVAGKIVLRHGDRIKIGSNSLVLYIGFPHERGDEDLTKKYDYDFFQDELASIWKIDQRLDTSEHETNEHKKALARIYNNYLKLMPKIAEANAISEELRKDILLSLFIKNLALYDSQGHEQEKEIGVKLTHKETNQIWIWNEDEFINRKFLMEEVYQKFLSSPNDFFIDNNDDPFWDPVQDIHVGSCHSWLQGLAYQMPLDHKVALHNYEGGEEGELQLTLSPCDATGEPLGEEAMIMNPNQLIGKRFDILISLKQCIGLNWIRGNNSRGVLLKFKFYKEQSYAQTRPMWGMINPRVAFKHQVTVQNVNEDFLTYLQTHALVIELWGLQEGRSSSPDSMSGNSLSPTSSMTSVDSEILIADLNKTKDSLLQTSSERDDLVRICKKLQKENASLKAKLKSQTSKNGNAGTLQAELGKALKVFFAEIKPVQQQLTEIKQSNKEFCSQVKDTLASSSGGKNGTHKRINEFFKSQDNKLNQTAEKLNGTVSNLKDLVGNAVRAHRNDKS